MEAKGYSLWYVSPPDVYDRFNSIISDLSQTYKSPHFQPHITLFGQIPLSEQEYISKTQQLATQLLSFTVRFEKLDYEDYYFRALYAKVRPTPQLSNNYKVTTELLGVKGDSYMPHVSLLYGNFPSEIKEKFIQQINVSTFPSFKITSVHLFKTNGTPEEWKKVQEFPFKSSE